MLIFSIIIPTYNRFDKLLEVLQSLNEQTLEKNLFEVIIVNDGSTDEEYRNFKKIEKNYGFRTSTHTQTNKGAAAARNVGIHLAKGEFILFLGDDTKADKNLLIEHLHSHRESTCDISVLGFIDWDKNLEINDFMKYIAPYGPQFDFRMKNPRNCGYKKFYTSNISLKTKILKKNHFNETFPSCNLEDVELGYRLHKQKIKISFNKNAIVYHDHYHNIDDFLNRQKKVGQNKKILLQLHPELRNIWSNRLFLNLVLIQDNVALILAKILNIKKLFYKAKCEKTLIKEFLK